MTKRVVFCHGAADYIERFPFYSVIRVSPREYIAFLHIDSTRWTWEGTWAEISAYLDGYARDYSTEVPF